MFSFHIQFTFFLSYFFITLQSIPPSIQSSGHLSQSLGPQVKLDPPHCSSLEPSISAGLSTAPLADVGSSCGVYLEFVWRKDPLNIPLSANKVTSDLLKLAMKEMHFYKSTVFLSPILRLSPALACAEDPIMGILSMWRTQ